MKYTMFLKEKKVALILLIFFMATSQIVLLPFNIAFFIKAYIAIMPLVCFAIATVVEYLYKKKFYNALLERLNSLNEKYLINEFVGSPEFMEGKITKEILEQTDKSMLENVNKYKYNAEDYKEYIELWIHEIKLPIAASKLVIENNKSKVTTSIEEELDKIENYVEQALFYARSNTVEQDYIISKIELRELLNKVILKNKKALIANNIQVELDMMESQVYTDSKWVEYIISQVIQNSIKYMKKSNKKIQIYLKENAQNVELFIKDNGIGIKESEKSRVFDKGFTGTNGRQTNKKSTGIGLYLCKKLCDKLGMSIKLDSTQDIGTVVTIVFPKGSHIIH